MPSRPRQRRLKVKTPQIGCRASQQTWCARPEDKAVDMYFLERAFSSTGPGTEVLFQAVLESYSEGLLPSDRVRVLAKLKQVQMRGRKRNMLG
jgi:tRNA A-37 threonylcarbamoyl transferase component Bud32